MRRYSLRFFHSRRHPHKLLARYFPKCERIADEFGREDPHESIVSGRHAREMLGFTPAHRWEMYFQGE